MKSDVLKNDTFLQMLPGKNELNTYEGTQYVTTFEKELNTF